MPYILPENKAIFFHIPRTGGTSIREWLFENTKMIRLSDHVSAHNAVLHKAISASIIREYTKFIFVRNPWSRVVSTWEFRLRGGAARYIIADNFEDFIRYYHAKIPLERIANLDGLLLQQHLYAFNAKASEYDVDLVGRFETLQEDFDKFCEIVGIPTGHLGHVNAGKLKGPHPHYSTYYTDETRQMVAELFPEDIKLFNYKFEEE